LTAERLEQVEGVLKEDPLAFSLLAYRYRELGDLDSALRCAERSLALSPMEDVTSMVADIHLQRGESDKWEQTLLKFLEAPDLGLQHGPVQAALARGYAERGQWKKALPYAVAFGETWSVRGLNLAAEITEGLAQWEESEQWVRAQSESYPSSQAYCWYFWCRRTGRGDLKAAQRLAAQWIANSDRQNCEMAMIEGAYHFTNGKLQDALQAYQTASVFRPSFSCSFMVALLARALRDEESRSYALDDIQKSYLQAPDQQTPDGAKVGAAGMAILQIMKSGDASPEKLAKIEELLSAIGPEARTSLAYCLGKELDALGKKEEAEKYWRRCLVTSGRELTAATLAGFELAKRLKTSRPDGDVLDETSLWPAPQAAAGGQ
jgi:tetratricopeptide (TPR) repeat protein